MAHEDDISLVTRAEWARAALSAYNDAKGEDLDAIDTDVTDLMADLLHLVDEEGGNTESVLRMVHVHYAEERT